MKREELADSPTMIGEPGSHSALLGSMPRQKRVVGVDAWGGEIIGSFGGGGRTADQNEQQGDHRDYTARVQALMAHWRRELARIEADDDRETRTG